MEKGTIAPANDNKDLCSFFVTKHSWKGKYKRIFSIGTTCITTYHPGTMEVTNRWSYSDVISLAPVIPKVQHGEATLTTGGNEMFTFTFMTKKRKSDTMKFSSEFRNEILCSALAFRHQFFDMGNKPKTTFFQCTKHHWSERKLPITLEIDVCSVNQISAQNGKLVVSYSYKDIDYLANVSDYPGGFIIATSGFNRLHLFACVEGQRDDLMKKICEYAWNHTGSLIRVRKDPITFEHFQLNKFGRYSNDESITSLYEFTVHKITCREFRDPSKRTLALTDSCLIERDPNSYSIITLKPLNEIFALIRNQVNPQQFSIEYIKGQVVSYTSTDRDALLASLLDGVRASGNIDVHVKMNPTIRGYRIGPYSMPVDEEVESWHLKFLQTPPNSWSFNEAVLRFNSNCSYSGLLHSVTQDRLFAENKEKLIQIALGAFVEKEGDQDSITNEQLEQQFQCLRRLVASKAGFTSFTVCSRFRDCLGKKVVKALKRNNDAVIHSAIDMLCALMQPMHDDYDLRQEQLNKSSLLSSKEFLGSLLDVMQYHVDCGTGALVVASMLDLLTFALCPPYSETTDGNHFDVLLAMTATYGKSLFKLFQHPSLAIVKGAGLVMKAIIEEAELETSKKMQTLALAEGAFPRHLQMALYTPESDSRYIACQFLSRQLIALWAVDNEVATQLLQRIFPVGLLSFLESKEKPPPNSLQRPLERNNLKLAEETSIRSKQNTLAQMRDLPSVRLIEKQVEDVLKHWREKIGVPKREPDPRLQPRPVVLRKRRERLKCNSNWTMFFFQFGQDHSRPDLIWNYKTREELRDALEGELRAFQTSKELSAKQLQLAWNHREFEVQYTSLSEELKIGDCYLRLLLEEGEKQQSDQLEVSLSENSLMEKLCIRRPYEFFNELYHKFLLASRSPLSSICLHAMTVVYGVYHQKIGPFHDVKWLLETLQQTRDRLQRDRLILLLRKLCVREENVKQLLDADGVKVLVDLLPLAHLHVSRAAPALQSNLLEASTQMQEEQADAQLEWHYADEDGAKQGPISFAELKRRYERNELDENSRCWAQGLDGWRPLSEIAQLKWTLLAKGVQLLNETQMSACILDILISICDFYPSRDFNGAIIRPLPRVKNRLSDSLCLPHIVQLLLTFDPSLVERVALLLSKVLEDNPAISRLYLSGCFYFLLMYSGSNVLNLGRLLHLTHLQQAFRAEERLRSSAMLQRSFLGQLLPAAMVCYLENHGPEKFAQILLGEFDTPEAIWNSEMRRLLAQKLSAHVADYSPRLRSNTRAIYQYCPMPAIAYPQLENELFCNIYYLKNLCDMQRFPNWPIRDPVQLLRDILEAWKNEVQRQPNSMSSKQALEALEMTEQQIADLQANAPVDSTDITSGLHSSINAAIRKAYFKLAQKYHPDKNPEGRTRFEEINRAYEFLCGESNRHPGGPDPINIRLMLQAQSILFKQCGIQLQAYKYAGYPMLVSTLRMETEDEKLFSKACPLLAYACETAFHTIKCSALNAEELRREGGLEILQQAFARCVAVLGASSDAECVGAQVCTNIVRCFTGAAAFPACRRRLLQLRCIGSDLARLLQLSHLTRLCLCTVQCVSAFAADAQLTAQLVSAGALHSLMLFLFKYDYTLEEGGVISNEESNQQELANQLAKVALIALARLAGELSSEEMEAAQAEERLQATTIVSAPTSGDLLDLQQEAPTSQQVHAQVQSCLASLLTPYLSRQLGISNAAQLLKTLNSNEENPYLIWDNGTRAELLDFLQQGQQYCSRNPITLSQLLEKCNKFLYSAHSKELLIGEVFVRIYNQQPMFPLLEPKQFTVALLDFIGSQAQYFHSAQVLQQGTVAETTNGKTNGDLIDLTLSPQSRPDSPNAIERVSKMEMALQALCNVIKYNSGVETSCIGHFRLLFSLLRVQRTSRLQLLGVQVISSVSGSQDCVEDIASSEVLTNLLLLLRPQPIIPPKPNTAAGSPEAQKPNLAEQRALAAQLQTSVLDGLLPLMANSKLVREALRRGGVLYLLEQFCVGGGAAAQLRERCAELLSKMAADKLVGPKVRLQLGRFLPPLFVDAMSDSPGGAVQLFDTSQENPELIWNEQTRTSVCTLLRRMATELAASQWRDLTVTWEPPGDLQLQQDQAFSEELQVAGVYVRLFVANPGWLLRRPKQFLSDLLEQLQGQLQLKKDKKPDESKLQLLGAGALALLNAQPAMMELIPSMGYVPTLLDALSNKKASVAVDCCVRLLEQLSQSKACVDAMLQHPQFIGRMEDALKTDFGHAGSVCDCVLRVLRVEQDQLMNQAMSGQFVQLLLKLLDNAQIGTAGKAQVVRLLKEMCESGSLGEQLRVQLDNVTVWKEFRDQKHDLFISSQPAAGFITAGAPNVAGYLTQGNSAAMQTPSNPPPIDDF